MPSAGPITPTVIIGREQELATISDSLNHGGMLLVSGEAGIGKSRLVREAMARAEARGANVLLGACFDRDQGLPYAPFLDLLRLFAAKDVAAVRERLSIVAPSVLHLLPEIADRFIDLPPKLEPEQEQRRIFHEMVALLTEITSERPLLVVIEDIHWSDETSLELLLHLARRMAGTPLVLLVTYRSDDRGAALSHFLAQIDRGRLASELELRPLTPSEVGHQLRALLELPRPPQAYFVRSLHELTGGNPFFVEEVLRSLIAVGDLYQTDAGWQRKPLTRLHVPRSVEDAVRRRYALLNPATRDLLVLAAVAGRRVDFALLQALTGFDDPTLLSALKEAIAAQILVEVSADHFAFRHELTRQAIYASLLGRERRTWHARVADVLMERGDDGDVATAELAYHTFAAERWEQARALSRSAGDRARALYAPQAAIEHYTRALVASERLGVAPDAGLLRARGQAFEAIGDFAAARADYEAARIAAEANGDARTVLSALLDLGLLWSGRDYDEAFVWFERAIDQARTLNDPAALGHTLNRLGNWYANHEETSAAISCHDEALTIFTQLDDRQGLAQTLDLLAMTHSLGGDIMAAQQAAGRAAILFEELNDRQGLAGALMGTALPGAIFELVTFSGGSSLAAAIAANERALALTRDIDWRSGEAYTLAILGELWAAAGEFGKALALLRQSIAIAEEIDHRQWIVQARWGLARTFGTMLAPTRERDELDRALTQSREIRSRLWISLVTAALASAQIRLGETAAATSLLTGALAADTPKQTPGQRLLWAAQGELTLANGQPREALAIVDQLYAATRDLSGEAAVPYLANIKAAALADIGQPQQAISLLREAQRTARNQGALPTLQTLHLALADLLRREHGEDAARKEATAAREIAMRLAATLPPGELHEEYLRATGLTASDAVPASQGLHDALTAREWEVAMHIAAGLSNRAIAEHLFVSARTVEAHVANILRKLGLSSRAGIAAWVARQQDAEATT